MSDPTPPENLDSLNAVWQALNTGIASEALGGVVGAGILEGLRKLKAYFGNKDSVSKDELVKAYQGDEHFRREILALATDLRTNGLVQIGNKNNNVSVNLGTISF